MSLILSLDTSTPVCSAALHQDGGLIITSEIHEKQAHGARLAPLIRNLFDASGRAQNDLDAVAVTSGPGSYTGLRIGTSTAKGLCFALNTPLIACDTLTLLASQVRHIALSDTLLCPMLDARRMEVYCAVFDSNLHIISPIESLVVDDKSFSKLLEKNQILFFGDGAAKCRNVLQHPNVRFLDDIVPTAASLGGIAWEKFQRHQFEDLVHFEPMYLKEFLIKKSTKFDALLNK
jgi:tRNA threonylcarbamoyladenosine biosynthesis protein TsaB